MNRHGQAKPPRIAGVQTSSGGAMDKLREFYLGKLGGRIDALEMAKSELAQSPARAWESLELIAHSLKGSGTTYGFPEISEAAGALEESLPETRAETLNRLLRVLHGIRDSASKQKTSILIVEDDPVNALILKETLSAPDRDIHIAETGEQARKLIGGQVYSVILLDLMLPDMDGRSFLMRLRENPKTAFLPVLVLSGKLGELTKRECLSLGADAFIQKPIDHEAIRTAVDSAVRQGARGPGLEPPKESWTPVSGTIGGTPPQTHPILVVDDDPLIAKIIRHRLEKEGYRTLWFADGEAALNAIQSQSFLMAILDVKMPMMDGFELLGRIREFPATLALPILILTSLGKEQDVSRGFDLGANDYLAKPFSPVELLARVRNLLRMK